MGCERRADAIAEERDDVARDGRAERGIGGEIGAEYRAKFEESRGDRGGIAARLP